MKNVCLSNHFKYKEEKSVRNESKQNKKMRRMA